MRDVITEYAPAGVGLTQPVDVPAFPPVADVPVRERRNRTLEDSDPHFDTSPQRVPVV